MHRKLFLLLAPAVLAFSLAVPLRAAEPAQGNPAEARLREALRGALAQLRTAETERGALQAAQADAERKNQDLAEQVRLMIKQSTADKAAAEKKLAALDARLAAQAEELARTKEVLAQSQAAHEKAAAAARAGETQASRLIAENAVLQRRAADLFAKNRELFKTATEVLRRYEKFGLGDALAAKEPFVGLTRVKLENLVQDYQDQLNAQRATP